MNIWLRRKSCKILNQYVFEHSSFLTAFQILKCQIKYSIHVSYDHKTNQELSELNEITVVRGCNWTHIYYGTIHTFPTQRINIFCLVEETWINQTKDGQILTSFFFYLKIRLNATSFSKTVDLPIQPTNQWLPYNIFLRREQLAALCGLLIHPIWCEVTIICGKVWKTKHWKSIHP